MRALRKGLGGLLWALGMLLSLPGAAVLWLAERTQPATGSLLCTEVTVPLLDLHQTTLVEEPAGDIPRSAMDQAIDAVSLEIDRHLIAGRSVVIPLNPVERARSWRPGFENTRTASHLRVVPKDRPEHS